MWVAFYTDLSDDLLTSYTNLTNEDNLKNEDNLNMKKA